MVASKYRIEAPNSGVNTLAVYEIMFLLLSIRSATPITETNDVSLRRATNSLTKPYEKPEAI